MADIDLQNLKTLANDKTSESRSELLSQVVDIRTHRNAKLRDAERELVDGILLDLAKQAEVDMRVQLADQIARLTDTSSDLVDFLIHDECEVARPMLMHSRAVSDDSLIKVIRTESEGHRVAIAGRIGIDADVCDALIEVGEDIVVTTLAGNETAEIDAAGIRKLVERSRNVEELCRPLLEREGLDPVFANQMFWWVSGSLRERILRDFPIDEDVLDRAMELATREAAAGAQTNPDYRRPGDIVRRANSVRVNDLINLLRAGDLKQLVAQLISDLGVSAHMVREALTDEGGHALALLCKAIGADRGQFTTMFLLVDYQRSKTPRPAGDLQYIAAIFDNVDETQAINTLCFWEIDDLLVA